jgi:hypothetical protein
VLAFETIEDTQPAIIEQPESWKAVPSGSCGLATEKCVPASEETLGELAHCCGLYCLAGVTGVYAAGWYPNGALKELWERAETGVW